MHQVKTVQFTFCKIISSAKITSQVTLLKIETDPIFFATPLPGQYVTVRMQRGGENIERQYSIVSAPKNTLEIVVKENPHGKISSKISSLRPGDLIEIKGPLGNHFLLEKTPSVYIGGGIGIAPFISMLQTNPSHKIYVLASFKNKHDVLFEKILKIYPSQIFLTQEKNSTDEYLFRRMNSADLKDALSDFDKTPSIYICGATRFVLDIKETLENLGVPRPNIKTEMFG